MQIVKVRLRKPRRVLSFLSYDLLLKRDEPCIVQTERGLEFGVCVLPPEPILDDAQSRTNLRVVRRLNEDDVRTCRQIVDDEDRAFGNCLEKIKQRKMPMKLVDVEYTFDRKKVVFFFTADDRVDFRELVRDLAHDLKTRIELRHIQVRDEAKMVGGIGSCGRELCCSTWLNEFKPISMRMAKRQNLALNPAKISGQCGRLLCCLSYENELYENIKRKKAPAAQEQSKAEAALEEDEPLPVGLEEPEAAFIEEEDEGAMIEDEPETVAVETQGGAELQQQAGGQEPRRDGDDKRRRRRKRRRKPGQGGGGA